jgi:hypothetical protein
MTPALGAGQILRERPTLDFAVEVLGDRAHAHAQLPAQEADALRQRLRDRTHDLLDEWSRIAMDLSNVGGQLQYQSESGAAQRLLHEFLNPALKQQPQRFKKFRANRSMRDVEPSVNLWLRTLDDVEIEEDEQP